MTTPPKKSSEPFDQLLANAEQLGGLMSAVGTQIFNKVSTTAKEATDFVGNAAAEGTQTAIEQTTESVGNTLHPISPP